MGLLKVFLKKKKFIYIYCIILIIILVFIVFFSDKKSLNPFIYFNF